MKSLTVVAGILLFAGSQWVLAGEKKAVTFDDLDTNHDGYISADEAKANPDLWKKFTQADKDSNGKLDVSEFSAFEERFVPADDMEEPEPGAAPTK